MKGIGNNRTTLTVIIGSLVLVFLMVAGTIWTGQSTREDTGQAVHSVSLLYLDELAGRREKVMENNLQDKVRTINVAIDLMDETDLSDTEHLAAYQKRMKQLFTLDKFAFVDSDGEIYTSLGMQHNIDEYAFDYRSLSRPEISLFYPDDA